MSEDKSPWYTISRLAGPFKALREDSRANGERFMGQLTPEAVHDQKFSTTRLMPGYAISEVDAFLDTVQQEIARLIQERDEANARALRSRTRSP